MLFKLAILNRKYHPLFLLLFFTVHTAKQKNKYKLILANV